MAHNFVSGHDQLVADLCEALGLGGRAVRRLVIEAAANSVVMVYVQFNAEKDQLARVTDAFRVVPVQRVDVAPDGTVTAEPCDHAVTCSVCRWADFARQAVEGGRAVLSDVIRCNKCGSPLLREEFCDPAVIVPTVLQ